MSALLSDAFVTAQYPSFEHIIMVYFRTNENSENLPLKTAYEYLFSQCKHPYHIVKPSECGHLGGKSIFVIRKITLHCFVSNPTQSPVFPVRSVTSAGGLSSGGTSRCSYTSPGRLRSQNVPYTLAPMPHSELVFKSAPCLLLPLRKYSSRQNRTPTQVSSVRGEPNTLGDPQSF